MSTETDGTRETEIQGRVVEWVTAALGASDTTEDVGVEAVARKTPSLPDDGLEVRPEDWTVEVTLRFSAADRGASAAALGTIAETSGTVTLAGGEAAEIEWPADAPDPAGPADEALETVVTAQVSIPWPSRNDEAAGAA